MSTWQRRAQAAFSTGIAFFCLHAQAIEHGRPPATSPVRVTIEQGQLIGLQTPTGQHFLGIPYAAAPVGELRWKPPQALAMWTSPHVAQSFGNVCLQPVNQLAQRTSRRETLQGSEDCLFLNVYRPRFIDHRLPVMVWIHGGSYLTGSGGEYDPTELAEKQGLIVVTINYRLGPFGFLAHPDLTAEAGTSGNYGILDQQAALRWVKQNIRAFGGDTSRITVFGESAGGNSVCAQVISPLAKDLFSGVIIESGLCGAMDSDSTLTEASSAGPSFASALGCEAGTGALTCMRALPAIDIARMPATRAGISGASSWGPVYGDTVLPLAVFAAASTGKFNHVPIVNGTNHDEGRFFAWALAAAGEILTATDYESYAQENFGPKTAKVLAEYPVSAFASPQLAYATVLTDFAFSCSAYALNSLLSSQVRTYDYEFNDPHAITTLPVLPIIPDLGAFHSSEIVYIFRTTSGIADPAQFSPLQRGLSDVMQANWAQFARTRRPNALGLPWWSRFTAANPAIQNFAPGILGNVSGFAADHHCDFWATL